MRDQLLDAIGKRSIGVILAIALLVSMMAVAATQGNAGAASQGQATPTPLPGSTPTPIPGATPTPLPPVFPTPAPVPTPEVTPVPVPGADAAETVGASLLTGLSVLLQEHVYGLLTATNATIHDRSEEAQVAQDALEQNSAEIARLIRSFYGTDAQEEFRSIWDEHVRHMVDYADTVTANGQGRDRAIENGDQFASELEGFLTEANPHLQPLALEMLLQEHGRLLLAAIEMQAQDGESFRAIMAARQAAHQTRSISAVLASALVRQFSEEVQVMDTVYAVVGAWNRRDVQTFLDLWTEEGFQQEFEFPLDQAAQFLPEFIGSIPIAVHDFSNIEVNGDEASAEIVLSFGYSMERFDQQFVHEDGVWKMHTSEQLTPEVPEGADVVDVEMSEFAFSYDESQIGDGYVSFRAINVGEQAHELGLLRLDEDAPSIQQILQTLSPEEGPPAGVQFLGGTLAEAGEEQILALNYPLTPGRYAMVCFLPNEDDPEGTPHALLGMVSEFEVE